MNHSPAVVIRTYRGGSDAEDTLRCFQAAIIETAGADYDPVQIVAWAGAASASEELDRDDLEAWDARRRAAHTVVADVDGGVVGFADFRDDAVLDMLFVHPDFGGRGVGRLLIETVQREAAAAGHTSLTTYASRTARPVFERLGFTVVAERPHNAVRGVTVPNYEMRWALDQSGS